MSIGVIITTAVAVYGAVLSTVLAVQQFRDRKLRLRVKLTLGALLPLPDNPTKAYLFDSRFGNPPPSDLILTAINTGQRAITLGALGVLPPNGDLFPLSPSRVGVQIPHQLSPNEACHSVWPACDIADALRTNGFGGSIKLSGYYVDQRGKLYRAKAIDFDIERWSSKGAVP